MSSPPSRRSATPRTDAAERFFHESGRPPVGFVDSSISRVLELELVQALAELQSRGLQAPDALPLRTQALSQGPRRPASSLFSASAPPPVAPDRPAPATQVRLLPARLAMEGLGEGRDYADGTALYRLGERTENVFILLEGQLHVSQQQDGSAEHELGPGHVFGEHGLFEEGVHTESITAVGRVRCALIPAGPLRTVLAADTSLLPPVLMALVLQYQQVLRIGQTLGAGLDLDSYEVLGPKTLTGPELHRALVEAKTQAPGSGLGPAQQLCLKLQTSEHLPTRLLRSGTSLGSPGDPEPLGMGLMLVQGQAQIRLGQHQVDLGQGSVVGVAEGLTGQPFSWTHSALQDLDVRAFPVERALARLERAEPSLQALASHLCALILKQQRDFQG